MALRYNNTAFLCRDCVTRRLLHRGSCTPRHVALSPRCAEPTAHLETRHKDNQSQISSLPPLPPLLPPLLSCSSPLPRHFHHCGWLWRNNMIPSIKLGFIGNRRNLHTQSNSSLFKKKHQIGLGLGHPGLNKVAFIANFQSGPPLEKKREYFLGHTVKSGKKELILRYRMVVLIDEDGTNLGELDSRMALGMAEGRGLKAQLVKDKSDKFPLPVFKMVSQSTLYKEEKSKKKSTKKKPQDVVKEVRFGTQISDHDFNTRIRHIRSMLESGNSVLVSSEVKAKGKWISPDRFAEMKNSRGAVIDRVEAELAGMGVRSDYKGDKKKVGEMALFRAVGKPAGGVIGGGGDGNAGGGGGGDGSDYVGRSISGDGGSSDSGGGGDSVGGSDSVSGGGD